MKKDFRVAFFTIALALMGASAFADVGLDGWWRPSGKTCPATPGYRQPAAWAAGQYVVLGRSVNGKRESVSRTLVVGKRGVDWVLETWTVNAKGEEDLVQVELSGYDEFLATGDASGIDVVRIIRKDKSGKVTVMEKGRLAVFGDVMRQFYRKMVDAAPAYEDGGAVTVPGGAFAGTRKAATSFTMFGVAFRFTSWYNGAIPVDGVVRTVSQDGKNVTELLAFGTDGKPRLQE